MLATMGFPGAGVAADTAILLREEGRGKREKGRGMREEGRGKREEGKGKGEKGRGKGEEGTLGLCISTQRPVSDLEGLKSMIAAVRAAGAHVLGIPMNPKTDRAFLERLGVECIAGDTPEAVLEAAAGCSVVLSSRLHLLILAANVGTPILGIARGSKLANWLANFGRTVEGSVSDCDWKKVTDHVLAALKDRGDWDAVRAAAYERLNARFETARAEFIKGLEGCHGR